AVEYTWSQRTSAVIGPARAIRASGGGKPPPGRGGGKKAGHPPAPPRGGAREEGTGPPGPGCPGGGAGGGRSVGGGVRGGGGGGRGAGGGEGAGAGQGAQQLAAQFGAAVVADAAHGRVALAEDEAGRQAGRGQLFVPVEQLGAAEAEPAVLGRDTPLQGAGLA